MKKIIMLSFIVLTFSCKQENKESAKVENKTEQIKPVYETIGVIEKLSPKLDKHLNSMGKIEIIAKGYDWSEGPLWLEKEKTLIWSDVPKNTVYRWREGQDAEVYLNPSGYTSEKPTLSKEPGSNGLLLNPEGKLVLCQHGDRRVAYMDAPVNSPEAKYITIADKYNGKRFNSPNDAVYDDLGNLYFTDPPYGLPDRNESKDKEIVHNGVYKVTPDGAVTVLVDSLTRPNGIAFNPDFTKCYVANSDPKKAYWAVYDITPEKTFTNGKILFDATSMMSAENKGLPDGLKVDQFGTLYATGPGGVFVLTSDGDHIGTIRTNQATANCCFNTDQTYLFMTADSYIMRLKLR